LTIAIISDASENVDLFLYFLLFMDNNQRPAGIGSIAAR